MRRPPRAPRRPPAWVAFILGVALVATAGRVAAQTAPTVGTPPPVAAEPTPPPATLPAPAPAPPLEAGDTAPPGVVQPVGALPTAGAPGAPPPAVTEAEVGRLSAEPRRPRVYETRWFWSAVAVVVITAGVVLALSLNPGAPSTPKTTLGDMRAF